MKTIDIKPIAQSMDARSMSEDLQLGGYRYVKNFGVTAKNKMCRISGWDKHLTRADYNNQDLHDQLQSFTGLSSRMPITLLFEANSVRKTTKLIAASGRVIYALNNASGNWKVISDKLGADTARWKAAELLDTVLFTNNLDPIVYWKFDQGITEDQDQSVATIPDLESVGITKAGVVLVWKDTVFLMNVVVNGTVHSNSIYWSNYQKPLDWIPNDSSTAGNADVFYGETILGALPMASRLIIYTNKGIWELQQTIVATNDANSAVFVLQKRYDPQNGESCLFYPNTLISTGNEHVYLGRDGVYVYDLFQEKPQRIEWIHKASSLIFDFINGENCDVHVAGYDTDTKEIRISYAKEGESLPSETLVLHSEYAFSYVLDYGFSAFATYTLKEPVQILKDFLARYCICTSEELEEHWGESSKEGGFCTEQTTTTDCSNPPQSIWTQTPKDLGDGVETEDYDKAEPDADSLCVQLDGITISDLCLTEERIDECSSGKRFIAASSSDFCIKEFSANYYREECTGFTGCGTYQRRGFRSLIRSGPLSLGQSKDDKLISRLEVEASSIVQTTPSIFSLRIGSHSQAVDPNVDDCGIIWDTQETKPIKCKSDTASVNAKNKTLPSESYEWPLYIYGRFIYFELEIKNPSVTPADTGGGCCISRITLDMELQLREWMG